jgi:hypothetical protein
VAQLGHASSQIDAGCGFTATALLVNNGNRPHEDLPRKKADSAAIWMSGDLPVGPDE